VRGKDCDFVTLFNEMGKGIALIHTATLASKDPSDFELPKVLAFDTLDDIEEAMRQRIGASIGQPPSVDKAVATPYWPEERVPILRTYIVSAALKNCAERLCGPSKQGVYRATLRRGRKRRATDRFSIRTRTAKPVTQE
jgi:hypothetical protein